MSAPSARPAPEASSGSQPGPVLVLLVRAAHPRQAVITALAMVVAAAASGRSLREVGLVLATVLVGQAVLGWDNDRVDEPADRAAERSDKPPPTGALERGTAASPPGAPGCSLCPPPSRGGTRPGGATPRPWGAAAP